MARRDPGYSGLEQMQVSERDAIIQAAATYVGNASALLDRDYQTTVVGNGIIDFIFKHPLLISRVAIQGTLDTVTVTAMQITGVAVPIVVGVVNANGWDSGPIAPPLMCTSVRVIAANATTFREVVIMTTLATQGVVNVDIDNTPANPLFAQLQQQIVLEECEITVEGDDWSADDPDNAMDKDLGTSISTSGPGTMHLALTHPKLIGRICIAGPLNDVEVSVIKVDGTTQVIASHIVADEGWDSGNFVPIVITQVDITITVSAEIEEVVILKVIEIKGDISLDWENTPADPLHVDAQQVVTLEEVDLVRSSVKGAVVTGGIADILDHDQTTGISYDGSGAQLMVTLELRNIMLLSRIAMVKIVDDIGMVRPLIGVRRVDGTWITVLDYADDAQEYEGVDSLNFKADVQTFGPNRKYTPMSPVEATAVRITLQAGVPGTIGEIVIHKTIETKSYVYNEPREPVHTQTVQQVVLDEVDTALSTFLPEVLFDSLAIERLFTKQIGVGLIQYTHNDDTPGVVTINFRFPILIARIAAVGVFPPNTSAGLILVNGMGMSVYVTSAPTTYGWDSGNFTPQLARAVTITLPNDADATLDEVIINKVIEMKGDVSLNVSNTPNEPVFVEAQQILVAEEIDLDASTMTGDITPGGTIAGLFDHNMATGVDYLGTGVQFVLTLQLKQIMLLSRIAMVMIRGGTEIWMPIIEVQRVDGTWVKVLDYTDPPDSNEYEGVDSGNFKANAIALGPGRPYIPTSPIESKAVRITLPLGHTGSIGEIAIHKTIETKSFVYNEPAEPVHTQDVGEVCLDEVDTLASTFDNTIWSSEAIERLFTKQTGTDPIGFTFVDLPGALTAMFRFPILINRVGIRGSYPAGTIIEAIGIDDMPHFIAILEDEVIEAGFDSGNFVPVLAMGIRVTVGANATFEQLTILKVKETKSYIWSDPAHPAEVQAEQQITANEVMSYGGTGTDPEHLLDKDATTYASIAAGAGSIIINLSHPILVSRVALMGVLDVVNVQIGLIDGSTKLVIPTTDAEDNSRDSGNFTPVFINGIIIAQGAGALVGSSLYELAVMKVIETKDGHSYYEPLAVQAEQQLVRQEIASIVGDPGTTQLEALFDKDMTTWAILGVGAHAITITLTHPILIGRVALRGNLDAISADVVDIEGVTHNVIPTKIVVGGLDSQNFTPLMATQIVINQGGGSMGTAIEEVTVLKVIETKVSATADRPVAVQALQQVSRSDLSSLTVVGLVVDEQLSIDKNAGTEAIFPAGLASITYNFNSPILVNRIALDGGSVGLSHVQVTVTDVLGVDSIVIADTGTGPSVGADSGNFQPIMAASVTVTQLVTGAGGTLAETIIQKVIEVKSFSEVQLPEVVEMVGQKVYYDQLDTNTGGAPALKPYMLTRIPLETNADDDPAQNIDSTIVTTTAGEAIDLMTVQFHQYSRDIRKVRNYFRAMVTVEAGTNAYITNVRCRVGRRQVTTDTLVWITAEKTVTLNLTGQATRHVRFELQDRISDVIPPGWVLVWQVIIRGYRVTGAVAVPITLWHRRGTFDCKLDTELVRQATEVIG